MSDSPPQSEHQDVQQERSPPSTSSSPDLAGPGETKRSRKREREISLEPLTTSKEVVDTDPFTREHKETRTPAKKNRTQLDATEEEEDTISLSRSNSGSPPHSASPPQEMKIRVRQISQGVEDLSWRNMTVITPERTVKGDSEDILPAVGVHGNGVVASPDTHANDAINMPPVPTPDADFLSTCSDVDSGDKSLKRKFVERGSQGPPEIHDVSQSSVEALKRPRDDAEKDDNPRETKRPSPPPEPKSPKSPKKSAAGPKLSGFMAYASTSSPFAAVKGQNIFSSNKLSSSPSPLPVNQTPVPPLPSRLSGGSSPPSSTAMKRSGFEAFASTSSPFSSASRSKSPVLGSTSKLGRAKSPSRRNNSANSNAFSSYASGLQSFAVPAQKRARAGSPSSSSRSSLERNSTISVFAANSAEVNDSGPEDERDGGPISFGEKLRAGKDDEDADPSDDESKVVLQEQDLTTGEEEEDTILQVRGKLFSLADATQWKERGTGTLKLNVRRLDGNGARLVMRKEAVYTLLLNVTLFPGMRCTLAQDPRFVRFSVIEDGTTTHYNVKLANAKIANDLLEEITANIPL